jgi:hypothetical protein
MNKIYKSNIEQFGTNYLYIQNKVSKTPFSTHFNIDNMLIEQPHNLGWKHYWRNNYDKPEGSLDNFFNETPVQQLPDLLFDGVQEVDCNRI